MTRPHILLVDDEPRNLDALEVVLSDEEYAFLRADSADSALRLLLEHQDIAAILLDMQMPRMNGLELARLIKGTKRYREIPLLFLTAHMLDEADVLAGYGVGAVDYLTKPLNPLILRQKVRAFIDLFEKTRALAELNEKLEQRVAERTAELERSEALLRKAAKQKDEFLAVLAHELRNPLAPLRTGVVMLSRKTPPGSPAARTLAIMDRQVDHLVRLIDDLLDISRISNGVLELRREITDLVGLLGATVDTFRAAFEKKGLSLELDLDAGDVEAIHASIDPTRVAQIVANVLHNASKFTPAGGRVRVSLHRDGEDALIHVADDGAGIPADQLQRIFEMFTKIARSGQTNAEPGTGIGLALGKRLAALHGGDLTAASEGEGRGAVFTLRLPALSASIPVDSSAPTESDREPRTRELSIVVVEDNPDVAESLVAWLEAEGHRVQLARAGEDGVALVVAARPDLVLCDVGLPDIDGNEVCRRVRARLGSSVPLMVAITGWGQREDRDKTQAAGFDHHVVKPLAPETLAAIVNAAGERSPAPALVDAAAT